MIEEERKLQEAMLAKEKSELFSKVVLLSGLHSFDGMEQLARDDQAVYDVLG